MAYDRESVYRLIAGERSSVGRDFMDKIVEDEWVLPLIPLENLRDYIWKHVPQPESGEASRFTADFDSRFKQNLRSIRKLRQFSPSESGPAYAPTGFRFTR